MEDLFASRLYNALIFATAVGSLVGLFISIWGQKSKQTTTALAVLFVGLSVLASYSYFKYEAIQSKEAALERRRLQARKDAAALLSGLPSYLFLQPGKARGVALAGLSYLEQYRDLYPETFKLAQVTIQVDIESAQKEQYESDEAHKLQVAGDAMLATLQGLAAHGQ